MNGLFEPSDWISAVAVAIVAELGFVAMMSSPERPAHLGDISDERAKPMAVAITPVVPDAPLLKLGTRRPGGLPAAWQRKAKPAERRPDPKGPLPTPHAPTTREAIPTAPVVSSEPPPPLLAPSLSSTPGSTPGSTEDAGAAGPVASSEPTGPSDAGTGPLGDPGGSKHGTETDPLKARALNLYRAQLSGWFLSRFSIRGKVPFERLKALRATATVSIGSDRRVTGFSVAATGDAAFDAEVRSTLQRIQSSGIELPAPPPLYPDVLGQSLPVTFQCSVRRLCE